MSTDWMWVYENPKDAAEHIDVLRGILWDVFNDRGRYVNDKRCEMIRAYLEDGKVPEDVIF